MSGGVPTPRAATTATAFSPTPSSEPRTPARPPASTLQQVGRYEMLGPLAAGGMAAVHLARVKGDGGFERLVAVKLCHAHLRGDAAFATMFLDEAQLAAHVRHPNVVATLDVGRERGELFIAMEYIAGVTLAEVIKAARRAEVLVPVPVALRLVADALAGLHAAHESRDAAGRALEIVHRDVTPQNVMVGVDGVARLVDFGIAKATSRLTVTREGQLKGKLPYMAPEQFTRAPITRVTDVYAAGVLLWETLAARRLFPPATDAETMYSVMHDELAPPSRWATAVPADLDAVVMRALARAPGARFPTAAAFADAVEACSVRPATAREVAAFLRAMVGEELARREAYVQSLVLAADDARDAPVPPLDVPQVEAAAGTSTAMSVSSVRRNAEPDARRARRWRAIAVAAVVTSVAALATSGVVALRAAREPSHAAAPRAVLAPPVEPVSAPAPPLAPAAPPAALPAHAAAPAEPAPRAPGASSRSPRAHGPRAQPPRVAPRRTPRREPYTPPGV